MSHHTHAVEGPDDIVRDVYILCSDTNRMSCHNSRVCNHSYSRDAIVEFLRQSGREGKICPASGCNKRITMANLSSDTELAKKIKMVERRLRRQEESDDDDDDEVIE